MSRYPESDERQNGRYNDGHSPYPSRNPYGRKNHALDFSTLQENPSQPLAGYQPRGEERHPPFQTQQQHVPHTHSRFHSATDPQADDPPLPSSSNQTTWASFYPHANPDDQPGDEAIIPIVRGSGQSYPGDQADNGTSHRRISHRVPRRHKTLKHVEPFHGNFVIDSTVPTKLLNLCALKDEREFTHIRYSAATGDPNDFKDNGFTLRQVHYDPPRRTELFIVMTMYNEDDNLFTRAMHGIMKNIAYLCGRDRSKTWGKDAWKKVVVCIVSDGRQEINSRTLSVVATIGAYQDGIATGGPGAINGRPVVAHIYEYTTQISVTPSGEIEGAENGIVPVQIIFCLKGKPQGKVNSHRWFFNAFGPILQPNICVLLDVGTMPGPSSIYHLWKAFDISSNIGGACGEIVVLKGKYRQKLLNPLVAAQDFEYKMSNILDKSLESVFGYVTVLPSAFSAYRYIALQNDTRGEGPLQKYFLGETMHGAGANIFTANMYQAEDRILCWELVSKRGGSWILHYVKSAYAFTDTPDQAPKLASQYCRLFNGSFFAVTHNIARFYYIYRSSHTFVRKFLIHLELLYHAFNLIFSWFALGNFFISFFVVTNALEDPAIIGGKAIEVVNTVSRYSYAGLLLMCFILSLRVGNRLGARRLQANRGYTLAFVGYAILTTYMTFAAIFLAIKGVQQVTAAHRGTTFHDLLTNAIFRDIVIPLSATIGSYFVASIIHMDPWHMITSSIQYTLLVPSYINILSVHAFSNVHLIFWGRNLGVSKAGTREDTVDVAMLTTEKDINAAYDEAMHVLSTKPPKEEKKVDATTLQEDDYCDFATNLLMAWVLSNAWLVAVVLTINGNAKTNGADHTVNGYLIFISYSVALLALVRFIGSTMYMIIRLFVGE